MVPCYQHCDQVQYIHEMFDLQLFECLHGVIMYQGAVGHFYVIRKTYWLIFLLVGIVGLVGFQENVGCSKWNCRLDSFIAR